METGNIVFEEQCVIDESKVFYTQNKVFRAIYHPKRAILYRQILNEGILNDCFENGLIRTKISEDVSLDGCDLILEHEKIHFFLHPAEMTNLMFWNAALSFVKISKKLAKHKLVLKDAHPWNLTFHNGKPVFFDFASIEECGGYNLNWFEEFYKYFAVPIRLGNSKWYKLANEYRRQHITGIGLGAVSNAYVKNYLLRSFTKLKKLLNTPIVFLDELEKWLLMQKPAVENGVWDNYEQGHNVSFDNPATVKQQFVYDLLNEFKPEKVIDLATNKGFYAFMAEYFGARVIAFDYEAFSVDESNRLLGNRQITFCQMNFTLPTPPYGWGLVGPDAFKRFRSDIGFALGLIHHICLVQRYPVKLFCDTCARYAQKGIILEMVDPEDVHVKAWNKVIPLDYNITSIKKYFFTHYKNVKESEIMSKDGIKRQFFFFYNN
jgi:hypothetical protein